MLGAIDLTKETYSRTLAENLFITLLALIGIAIFAAGAGLYATTLPALPEIDIFEAQINVKQEPVERAAYLAAVIATLPMVLLLASFAPLRRWVATLPATFAGTIATAFSLPLAAVFIGSSFSAYLLGLSVGGAQDFGFPIFATAGCAAISAAWIANYIGRKGWMAGAWTGRIRPAIKWGAAIAVILSAVAVRIRIPATIDGDPHFEAVFYSLSQVMAGKTLLADLPSQYGHYAELLRPVFGIIGLSVLKFSIVMVGLQAIATLLLFHTLNRLLSIDELLVVSIMGLLWIVGSTWVSVELLPRKHEYFQLWPIRFLFPAVSLFLFVRAREASLTLRKIVGLAALAGAAVVWNLDSGVAVMGALFAYALVRAIFADPNERHSCLFNLVAAAAVGMGVVGIYCLYLYSKADNVVAWADWIKFQRIFYASGFGMLPLPRSPHPWMAVMTIYLYGLVVGVFAHSRRRPSVASDTILYLSVLGIGLFAYYQGRSHDVVLSFVFWPAILISLLLADRTLRAIRAGLLSKTASWSAFPVVVFTLMMAAKWLIAVPSLVEMTSDVYRALASQAETRSGRNIAFVRHKVGNDTTAVILAPGQSVYFAETGLASAVSGPGIIEMLLTEDFEKMMASILTKPVAHVFVQLEKDGLFPAEYVRLLDRYRRVEVSTDGLQYLEPI